MRNRAAEACPWRRLSGVLTDHSSWNTFDGRGTQGRSRDIGGPQRGEDHLLVSSVVDTWPSFLSLTFCERIWEPGNSRDAEPGTHWIEWSQVSTQGMSSRVSTAEWV